MTNPTGSILLRRGPTTDRLGFTPLVGEIIYDTTQNKVYVGNATTVGGIGSVQADFPNPGVMIKGLTAESFLVAPGQTTANDPHIQYLSFDKSSGSYLFTSISASGSALTSITFDTGTGLSVARTDVVPNVNQPTLTTTGTVNITLNPATNTNIGGVIPDGSIITVSGTGAITTATATSSALGVVKPDGTIITVNAGAITVATATSSALGVVKPDGTIITVNLGTITVAKSSSSAFGVVQVDNSTITSNSGTITANWPVNNTNGSSGPTKIAIGQNAGTTQGTNAIAIGTSAGTTSQGANAIAIGYNAGTTSQASGSIVINASGNSFSVANAGFYIDPIRNDNTNVTNALFWNSSTNEITYGPALPAQSSAVNGYFLTTNGTSASWATVTAVGLTAGASVYSMLEHATITASAPTSTINFDILTQSVQYYTSSTTNSFIVNVRGNSTTTLESVMSIGQSNTFAFLVNCASTSHYATSLTIDGNASGTNGYTFSVKWQGGVQPTAGDNGSTDVYTANIIKTAAKTYTVLASVTKFA